MLRFLRQHLVLSLGFLAALLVTLVFLARFTMSALVWSDPEMREQPVAGWMTPRYVARSWQVEPAVVAEALGLAMDGTGRRLTLEEIARDQGRSVEALIADLNAAIAAERAARP